MSIAMKHSNMNLLMQAFIRTVRRLEAEFITSSFFVSEVDLPLMSMSLVQCDLGSAYR